MMKINAVNNIAKHFDHPKYCYKHVFILTRTTLTNDYARLEDEREQVRKHNFLIKIYQLLPCPFVYDPILSPEERVDFIFKHI